MIPRSPIERGVILAALAALLFGSTAPLLQRASEGAGALACAGLLYLGAAASSASALRRRRSDSEAPLLRSDFPRLSTMAALGAVMAPAALLLGLARTDAATATLLLALEGPFTFLLARLVYREHLGRRVIVAMALIFAGGLLLGGGRVGDKASLAGGGLVALATLLWAFDNTLSRQLADRDPVAVVGGKGLLGGAAALLVSLALGEQWPSPGNSLGIVAIGALGYGVSLRLYLKAQRGIGAARTASVFSAAPFVGAGIALAMGAPFPGWTLPAAALLILLGVWLHASERHGHAHHHAELVHDHAHVHGEGHHVHPHAPGEPEPHSHLHRHDPVTHEHEHGEDLHHVHPH